jgi:predicted ATPase with chaperone activity
MGPEGGLCAPHHTISSAGLVGGGSPPRPGEIPFAHHGALVLENLEECCALNPAGRWLVADPVDRGGMSARAVHRAMRVARTIADLEGEDRISVRTLAEAMQYRAYKRKNTARRSYPSTDDQHLA